MARGNTAKTKKGTKSKKSSVQVRDLKASKDPKGGIIAVLRKAGKDQQDY
jgi:hypothetical protein